jgi:membrane fusion protein (multidrug efflux system)
MAQVRETTQFKQDDQSAIAAEYRVRRPWRKIGIFALIALTVLLLLVWGLNVLLYNLSHQQTDDAYVDGQVHPISTRISGTVTRVLVDDNQFVRRGQLLVQLDPRDYQTQVAQASAALALAERQSAVTAASVPVAAAQAQAAGTQAVGNIAGANAAVAGAQAGVSQARADVAEMRAQLAQANANLAQVQADFRRYQVLVRQGAISRQQFDQALAAVRVAQATRDAAADNVRAAQAKLSAAEHSVAQARAEAAATRGALSQAQAQRLQVSVAQRQSQTSQAAVAQAAAQLRAAELMLSYTNIIAPADGFISKRTVEVGQRLQPGQSLMSLVENKPWITANFKETQLERVRPGQLVSIHIDAFPHRNFSGVVASLAPASGAQFALLPPENATGNFTKIVQRIPVKIVFDPRSIRGYEGLIRPGMSCEVSIATR